MHVAAIIAAGGRGTRFGSAVPKQLLMLAGRPLLQHSVETFLRCAAVHEIVVALPPDIPRSALRFLHNRAKPIDTVAGGQRRQDSVTNAVRVVSGRADVIVIHDAARALVSEALIARTVESARETGAAVAALKAVDTVKRADRAGFVSSTLDRDEIFLAQTPQAFRTSVLADALAQEGDATDEASLAERAGHRVRLVEGEARNVKITTPDDMRLAEQLLAQGSSTRGLRVGNGYDLHRLVEGRPLVLGGVNIPHDRGLLGHSDADAVCHAVTDAVLGAAGAGDIGRHFPDTDPAWRGADSLQLLARAAELVRRAGFGVVNVDVVVIAQRPKLAPHVDSMRANVARALGIDAGQVSVKGKTNEGVDSTGAGESIAVHAVALVAGTHGGAV